MKNKMERELFVPLSHCDNTSRLSVPFMFNLFMDIATDHANELHLSSKDLGENMFWLATRTKVIVNRRPEMSEKVTLATWPEKAVRVRANRHYTISDEQGVAIAGKTEWAVINTQSGKLQRLNDIYGEDFDFCEDVSCEESYARVKDNFDDAEIFAEYTIRSTDIDVGQHMNNAAYVRALFSLFSCKELEKSSVREIDITYKNQSFEGETLTIKVREAEDGAFEYGMIKPDSTVAAVVRIVRE
ncbi:MAG: hypothetical protein IJ331_03180 [Ruminococcus sp.]|nr:hypothetical protein [Ruminococcus sp.]